MISTRGVKPRFHIGERVLCYEPDPKKIKILYDAKVLGSRPSEKGSTEKSRRCFDYLVHFLGWSNSWDRYVSDDMLLKDNEAGRKEQKYLFEQTEEFILEKKKKRKSTDKTRVSLDSNPSPAPSDSPEFIYQMKRGQEERLSDQPNDQLCFQEDDEIQFKRIDLRGVKERTAEKQEDSEPESERSTSLRMVGEDYSDVNGGIEDGETNRIYQEDALEERDGMEDICTELIPLNFSDELKLGIELDFKYIAEGKFVKLPAEPNIISLLETYVRSYATNRLAALEKQLQKHYNQYRQPDKDEAVLFEDALASINVAKEVAESVRILMDFHLGNILLYPQETDQFVKSKSLRPHMDCLGRIVTTASALPPHTLLTRQNSSLRRLDVEGEFSAVGGSKRKLNLRKKESESETPSLVPGSVGSASSGGGGTEILTLSSVNQNQQHPQSNQSLQILRDLVAWRLVPESVYFEEPSLPSLVYGGVHLARFVAKIPELLIKTKFPNKKIKHMMKFLDFLVDFISTQEDVFSDWVYSTSY